MKQTIKMSLAIIFAALLTTATASILTGCSGNKKESGSSSTSAVETTVPKTTGSNGQSSGANQTKEDQNSQSAESNGSDNTGSQSDDGKTTDSDGYIDEQTAVANVKQQAGSGAAIISSTKGFTPDGIKAWVIVVQPVTNTDSTDTVTYYSDIDQQTAVANVKQQAGTGATIVSSTKGFTPDGIKAWVIVVQPVTNTDSADTLTYYSGYQFCYPEDKA